MIQVTRTDIKWGLRYLLIAFICYIVWYVLQKPFLEEIKSWTDIGKGIIYTPLLATLGYLSKWNWTTKPS